MHLTLTQQNPWLKRAPYNAASRRSPCLAQVDARADLLWGLTIGGRVDDAGQVLVNKFLALLLDHTGSADLQVDCCSDLGRGSQQPLECIGIIYSVKW